MQEAAKQQQQIVFSVEDKEQKQVTKCENNEVPFEEALNMTGEDSWADIELVNLVKVNKINNK